VTVPSKADIKKRQDKLDKMLKGLNEDGSMSEKKLCTQLRSAIRKVWMQHPVKLSYLYKHTYPDMDDSTRTKWKIDCEVCGDSFKINEVQVDHIKGEHSLLTLNDVVPFANSILGVTHDDLQIACVECHEALTYAERYGMSLEDARKEKEVIAKLKQSVTIQKKELKKAGYKDKDISNEEKRRNAYREILNRD